MKKILASLALLASAFQLLLAVPAYPGRIRVTQPDGSVLTVQLHGDEWLHYITDETGQVVARGADGFFRPAEKPTAAQREEAAGMRRAAQQLRSAARAQSLSQGTHRIPVILVNFSDREFIINNPATAFANLLNQQGYAANGATGSVHDYYSENSHGLYDPVFDVYGPVTLSKTSEYYAYNKTGRAKEALREACGLLDEEIDFTQYDSDNDNAVDMILMYYAGHNQAETADETTIWPHQGYASGTFDGVSISRYFCTSELKGTNSQMCGIGTTVHEFGHSLGLPDFYDTDYEENGSAGALYAFSTMCDGAYNNNGRTPPYLNSEELMLLGWMDGQTEITTQGDLTVEPVQNRVAYRTPTSMDGEYFVYECRVKTGWDRFIPGQGLVVYHVDKSNRESLNPGGYWGNYYTPANLWRYWTSTNAINAFGAHPCFYVVPAANQSSLNYFGNGAYIPFPGGKNVKTYTPVDWDGVEGDYRFTDIAFDGSKVTAKVRYTAVPGVQGIVRNMAAKPVRGATVSVYRAGGAASAPGKLRASLRHKAASAALLTATTDVDGAYSFEDASLADGTFTLVVTCDGYVEAESTVTIGRKVETCDFYLRKVGESEESTFCKYDPDGGSFLGFGYGNASFNHAAGIVLSVEEAAAYAGKQIKLISFQPYGDASTTVDAAYVFIEAGGSRVFTQKVADVRFDAMNTVNVVSQEFYIPTGSQIVIGYGLVGCSETHPLLVQACAEENTGVIAQFNQARANDWSEMVTGDGQCFTPVLSAAVGEPVAAELGFNHIANPGNGTYAAGDRFNLALVRYEDDAPSAVSWVFDGQSVQADAVTLTAGTHRVEAHLTYPDGSVEVIRLVINAQ